MGRSNSYAGTRYSFLRHAGAVPDPHQRVLHDGGGDGRGPGTATSAPLRSLGHVRDLCAGARCGLRVGLRVPGSRLPNSLRRSLQRPLDALVVPDRIAVGRSRWLASVVGVPTFGLHVLRDPLASRSLHGAAAVDHRHAHEHSDLLRNLDALRGQPVCDVHPNDPWRRRRPQSAASELLDGHPSAHALPRVCGLVGSVRDLDRGAHHRAPWERMGSCCASMVDDRLDLPVPWPAARPPLVVRRARLGRLLGLGPG